MDERYAHWRQRVEAELGSAKFEDELVTRVPVGVEGGLRIEPLYTSDHPSPPPIASSSLPGQVPYTRGASWPRARGEAASGAAWSRCSRYLGGDLRRLNREILADLAGGIDCLWLEISGRGIEGRIAITAARELDRLLSGVLPQAITMLFDGGADALPTAALLLAWLDEHGFDPADLELRFAADPLGELARQGRLPAQLDELEAETAALAGYCTTHLPRARALAVSTLPYHDGGAHPAQELACAVATLLHYLRWLTNHGLSLHEAALQIELRVAVDQDLFLEIAKLRALRTLWSKVFRACGEPAPPPPYLHAVASRRTLSRRAPWMNLLRGTGEVVAAVVAGAERITNTGYADAFGDPNELSRRLARNTHTILAEESHLGEVADPAGGSYYVEALSDRLARDGWAHLQEIERRGGMAECLRAGFIQEQVAQSWAGRRAAIAHRRQPITGVSEFAQLDEEPARQEGSAASGARGGASAEDAELEKATVPDLPANPPVSLDRDVAALIHAAKEGASLAQLAGTLPRHQAETATPIPPQRDALPFERLRDAADSSTALGQRPTVFLACLGPLAEHKARASFARRAFAAGGLAPVEGSVEAEAEPPERALQLADEFARSGARVVAICGSDDAYDRHLSHLAQALSRVGAARLVLVGQPGAREGDWREAGIDQFLFRGCDLVALLTASLTAATTAAPTSHGEREAS